MLLFSTRPKPVDLIHIHIQIHLLKVHQSTRGDGHARITACPDPAPAAVFPAAAAPLLAAVLPSVWAPNAPAQVVQV